jgi:hypothetical protein
MQHTSYYLHSTQTNSDGCLTKVDFKAYAYSDGQVFWSVERLYDALTGPGVQKTKLKEHLKKDAGAWQVFGHRLGLNIQVEKSANQIRHIRLSGSEAQANCYTRDEVTISSLGFIAVQVLWGFSRRQRLWQARAKNMLLALFSRCVEAAAVSKDRLLNCCRGAAACRCQEGAVGDDPCEHLQELNRHMDAQELSGVAWAAHFLVQLGSYYLRCDACCDSLKGILQDLAAHINSRLPELQLSTNPLMEECARGPKTRKRIDEDLKRELTETIIQKRKAVRGTSLGSAVHGMRHTQVRDAENKKMAAYRNACWRHFQGRESGVFTLAEDGARIGNPSENTEIYIFQDQSAGKACVLPNQASIHVW